MATETPQAVTIIDIQVNDDEPDVEKGQGIGGRFMQQAKAYCDAHGKQLIASNVAKARGFYEQLGFMSYVPARRYESDQYVYDPNSVTSKATSARTCPVCGDPLKGEHGTFCPRCQWSETDVNLDRDPLSNPPDPTVDMHRGIQAAQKMSDKLHDFLMNPKSRPDLQTPEGQAFLQDLKRNYHNEKTDALMPWLTREWKRGRLHFDPERRGITWRNPAIDPEFTHTLGPSQVNHWGDFLQSNHPIRHQLGDIMKHDLPSFHQQVSAWDQAMKDEAQQQALQNGRVVHQTPDSWTVRQLTTPEELEAEGDAMGHCVGSYCGPVQRGDTMIYSLRDPQGVPHVTTEIQPQRHEYIDDAGTEKRPLPHGGRVVQIQGRGNAEPKDEYKARLADWFRSFAPEDRPTMLYDEDPYMHDYEGYGHIRLDEPELIPKHEEDFGYLKAPTEPTENDYGLLQEQPSLPSDYDSLLEKLKYHDYGSQGGEYDATQIDNIYRLARERGEIPELAKALEHYQTDQDENFQQWMDMNYEYAPRYPDEPTGWENQEGEEAEEAEPGARAYWRVLPDSTYGEKYYDPDEAEKAYDEEYADWERQHPGMQAVSQFYGLLNPHYYDNDWQNEPAEQPAQQPQPPTVAAMITVPSHRWGGKWFEAVEDSP